MTNAGMMNAIWLSILHATYCGTENLRRAMAEDRLAELRTRVAATEVLAEGDDSKPHSVAESADRKVCAEVLSHSHSLSVKSCTKLSARHVSHSLVQQYGQPFQSLNDFNEYVDALDAEHVDRELVARERVRDRPG